MRTQTTSIRFGGPITPIVKSLMFINGGIFIFQQLLYFISPFFSNINYYLGLHYIGIFNNYHFWQLFTYMFIHTDGLNSGWLHIIFNLITLWMFAGDLENLWGSSFFLKYYLLTGLGAGLFITGLNFYQFNVYQINPITIGASGAIYGILLAYGMTWPNRIIYYILFPIKTKYLVLFFGIFEFFGTLASIRGVGGSISHIGHLGGLLSGLIILKLINPHTISLFKVNPFDGFFRKRRLKKHKLIIDQRIKAKETIDSLLLKIARNGMQSLTDKEKKELDWARKHYKPSTKDTMH